MMTGLRILLLIIFAGFTSACEQKESMEDVRRNITAKDILGNQDYLAMSYGGYRTNSRRVQPTIGQLKDDMKILSALGVKVIRTYNVHLPHAVNVLKAIDELNQEDESFEMYVMLGAWIDCKNAWTGFEPIHSEESERNEVEINRAVELANEYPEIIKVIAVGNEAMVKWATSYYVEPGIILKWVNHLQQRKEEGELDENLWITSSDNFASWGGGDSTYHTEELNELIAAVDYVSLHTYPMHDTHYNPVFWGVLESETDLTRNEQIDAALNRSIAYAQSQFNSVADYVHAIDADKPLHIGETGWASFATDLYGDEGSKACDEFKQAMFYNKMRAWTNKDNISCFYFEAFDEPWKDANNKGGSENHFGLFTVDGEAKFALWDEVDNGNLNKLSRDGNKITKSFDGNEDSLMKCILLPPTKTKTSLYVPN